MAAVLCVGAASCVQEKTGFLPAHFFIAYCSYAEDGVKSIMSGEQTAVWI